MKQTPPPRKGTSCKYVFADRVWEKHANRFLRMSSVVLQHRQSTHTNLVSEHKQYRLRCYSCNTATYRGAWPPHVPCSTATRTRATNRPQQILKQLPHKVNTHGPSAHASELVRVLYMSFGAFTPKHTTSIAYRTKPCHQLWLRHSAAAHLYLGPRTSKSLTTAPFSLITACACR